ncbi:tetratricopeptide repeat protein [Moorena producens JHB]|uniref:Tetratricopeptide repeat protein n=1 Tax=Moorena producens (strain JHB) TaxID=1454205 RepID=A0A1D9G1V5_MOOP1|nr:tetratricopeptide repeat protein [Moorena producens]AOY81514.1 tetratricopeptide repeat protein [Moorena producens JHB]
MIDNLKQTIQHMDRLQTEQRYSEAEALCHQTIKDLPSSEQGYILQISLQNRLALILEAQSRYQQALTAVDSAQKILETIKASISPAIALSLEITTLSTQATLQRIQGNYAEAEQTYQRAIELIETQGTEQYQSKRIQLANNLAIVYKYWGKFDAAERLYQQTLATLGSQYGNHHPDIATVYHNLAGLHHARGDYQTAENWARQSYQLHIELFGSHHPKTIADGAALGSILHGLQQWDEAITYFETAITFFEQQFGSVHYDVALNLNNLAASEQAKGNLSQAEEAYRRALEIKTQLLGESHPERAITLNNLASVLKQKGKTEEAKEFFEQARAIFATTLGEDHPNTQICKDNIDL